MRANNVDSPADIAVNSPSKISWRASLVLLWSAYALVGWNLAAHHVIWFMGFLSIALSITMSWVGNRLLKQALQYIPTVLLVILTASLLVALVLTSSLFLTLAFVPFLTTYLAWNEMRFVKFSQMRTFWILLAIAILGLGIGEILDLWILPSARY
jgi:hypothetical protein